MEKVHREANIKMLTMDNNEGYTLWADPMIIDLKDKGYAEKLYTGQEGDRPILVGLKELPIFVNHKYRKGNAMGGTKEAIENGFEVVEVAGKRIKHVACDSEFYNGETINFLQSKEGTTFTIVADKDVAVKEVIKHISEDRWRPYYDIHGIKTDREFEANAMYFSIGVLTYNLMIAQKHFIIQEGIQNCTIGTLRWKLVQVAAWIAEHGNRVKLKIATTLEKFNHYIRMLKRMEAIAALPY